MDAKPLFIVIIFVLILAVIASGIIGNVDLTDGGQTQQLAPPSNTSSGGANNTLSGGAAGLGLPYTSNGQPVDGKSTSARNSPCGPSYTVKSGDTLSSVSRTCLISLEDLLAVNPSITNPHMISVGQKITIYTDLPIVTPLPIVSPLPTQAPAPTSASGPGVSTTLTPGKKPGELINIDVHGFPAGAQVQVGIGKVGEEPSILAIATTDQNGILRVPVLIPLRAKADETWTITITTVKNPRIQATAVPFIIGR